MTLTTGGEVHLGARRIEGSPKEADHTEPKELILDGQQRITSLYQACFRYEPVEIGTTRKKAPRKEKFWFYIDMKAALDGTDREEAIIAVPESKIETRNFGREIVRDLSSDEQEYKLCMFPVGKVFAYEEWGREFRSYWNYSKDKVNFLDDFQRKALEKFNHYHVPVIGLPDDTKREAVCLIFEKVNTKGEVLTVFELLTASYAVEGFKLREDWELRSKGENGLKKTPYGALLARLEPDDFLQVVSLLATGSARKKNLLRNLTLPLYKEYADRAEEGLKAAAKFLKESHMYAARSVPHRSQIPPLAAILAKLGAEAEKSAVKAKVALWYWCGVFGRFYSKSTQSQAEKDYAEVCPWAQDMERQTKVPETVNDSVILADTVLSTKSMRSPIFRGVTALLMRAGEVTDWWTGESYKLQVDFREKIDIHHIFPEKWCKDNGIPEDTYDTIGNKTPLSKRTNIRLGGKAPSYYLQTLEKNGVVSPEVLDEYVTSHQIDPELLRKDDFAAFFETRRRRLIELIEDATGKKADRAKDGQAETDIEDEEY